MQPESVESAFLGESTVKHGMFVIDVLVPCTEMPAIQPITL